TLAELAAAAGSGNEPNPAGAPQPRQGPGSADPAPPDPDPPGLASNPDPPGVASNPPNRDLSVLSPDSPDPDPPAMAQPGPAPRARPADSQPTDDQLLRVWEAVLQLHAHRVAHRALTADRILFSDHGEVVLLDPGAGDVAATDLQLRLDVAQLLAELALLVGPERTASLAAKAVGADELVAVVPLLQPIVLYRSTRAAVRRRRDVLPALRKRL